MRDGGRLGRADPHRRTIRQGASAAIRAAGADVVDVSPEYHVVTASPRGGRPAGGWRDPRRRLGRGDDRADERCDRRCVGWPRNSAAARRTTPARPAPRSRRRPHSSRRPRLAASTTSTAAGVKVGVLSDNFDGAPPATHAAEDMAIGDLPGPGEHMRPDDARAGPRRRRSEVFSKVPRTRAGR